VRRSILNVWQKEKGRVQVWLWLWLGVALPLVLSRLLARDVAALPLVFGQIILGLGVSCLYLPVRWFRILLIVVSLVFTVGGFAQRWFLASSFTKKDAGQLEVIGLTQGGAVNVLSAGSEERAGVRVWQLARGTTKLELSFEARLREGELGWNWYSSDRLEPHVEGETLFTRWQPSSESFLRRRYTFSGKSQGPLRFTVVARATEAGCGRLRLREMGEEARTVERLCLTPTWQEFSYDWLAQRGQGLTVTLDDFAVSQLDLYSRLEVQQDEIWQPLTPAPTGVALGLTWAGQNDFRPELRFLPTSQWERYTLEIEEAAFGTLERITTFVEVEPTVRLELRNVNLRTLTPGLPQPTPVFLRVRQSLFTPHPNLAGHMLTTVACAIYATAAAPWLAFFGMVVSLGGIWLTGSRTAFFANLLGFALLFAFTLKRWRWSLYVLSALVVVGCFAFLGTKQLGRVLQFEGENISRPRIWGLAWQLFTEHPLTGVSTSDFAARAASEGMMVADMGVSHAHNFWLHMASSYGLGGLIASLWLTTGLSVLAWRWGRWRGVTFLAPIFLMNMFDYSLFYIGVLLPLSHTLNVFWVTRQVQKENKVY
jgi:hypothetical protein